MRYLKKYESYSSSSLEDKINLVLSEIDIDGDDILRDCPLMKELNILHQREYIDELFWDIPWGLFDVTLEEFKKTYNSMITNAEKKILKMIETDASIYAKWGEYIENYIDVPKWLVTASKYNI